MMFVGTPGPNSNKSTEEDTPQQSAKASTVIGVSKVVPYSFGNRRGLLCSIPWVAGVDGPGLLCSIPWVAGVDGLGLGDELEIGL